MNKTLLPVFALLLAGAAQPEQAWKKAVEQQNFHYAREPHGMLKINDSAYLGEGQSATLVGEKGKPASWRWSHDAKAQGPMRISVSHGRITMLLNGKLVDPATVEKSVPVDIDVDVAGHPTQVDAGVIGWRVFIYNQKAVAARDFKGVSYYPYDPAFAVTASFKPDPALPPRVFRTSRGTDKQFFHAGDASFNLKGQAVTLPFYADSNDPKNITEMSAFYTDKLTGKGAYGAGRYVDIDGFGKFPPKTVSIDFNYAYNPNCARSAHFTCPVAVDDIKLAMTAGERDPHALH